MAQKSQVDKHIRADGKLDRMARILPVGKVERRARGQCRANVGEIAEVEQVARGAPQHDGDRLKHKPQERGNLVLCHAVHPRAFLLRNLSCHYARGRLKCGRSSMTWHVRILQTTRARRRAPFPSRQISQSVTVKPNFGVQMLQIEIIITNQSGLSQSVTVRGVLCAQMLQIEMFPIGGSECLDL